MSSGIFRSLKKQRTEPVGRSPEGVDQEPPIIESSNRSEVERREMKERFEHTRYVAHYAEAYVKRRKAEEFNKFPVIEAWEMFSRSQQEANYLFCRFKNQFDQLLKHGSEVTALRSSFKKEMDTLKAEYENRAKLVMAEKESLKEKLSELEGEISMVEELKKQVAFFKDVIGEKDKFVVEQKKRLVEIEREHQLKYEEGTLYGLESAVDVVLEKYPDLDVSNILSEIEESKAEIQEKLNR